MYKVGTLSIGPLPHETNPSGSATFWALHSIPYFLTSFGVYVPVLWRYCCVSPTEPRYSMMSSLSPLLLKLMTWGVLAWEVVGPFTLMSPWRTGATCCGCRESHAPPLTDAMRYVGVLGTFLLHFGFALCMKLEEFVWVQF